VLDSRRYLIFGPAYLDVVVETAQPLLSAEPALLLDQSLAALRVTPRDDGLLVVLGPTGDLLRFILPQRDTGAAASYHLAEPVLARLRGTQAPPVQGAFTVERFCTQLGGMGAGYAAAFAGVLRAPFGTVNELPDATAGQVLHWLAQQGIRVAPAFLPDCASDSSLVLLSARGDKLAIGVRQAMLRWRAGEEERALAATADALVFCGAPNALLAEVLSWRLPAAVMCARSAAAISAPPMYCALEKNGQPPQPCCVTVSKVSLQLFWRVGCSRRMNPQSSPQLAPCWATCFPSG